MPAGDAFGLDIVPKEDEAPIETGSGADTTSTPSCRETTCRTNGPCSSRRVPAGTACGFAERGKTIATLIVPVTP